MATNPEKLGYARGYQAGLRRKKREDSRAIALAMREEFERQVFIAVLPQLLSQPWRTGDKTWTKMEDFISGAQDFATKASKRFPFTPPPVEIDHAD